MPQRPARPRDVPAGIRKAWRSRLLGLPEDLRNLLDLAEELVRYCRVHRTLGPARPGQLGRLVEELVQVRVLLEVRRLEVVSPQHPQVVLDELGALLLDDQRPGAELGVRIGLVLLADRLDRLGLDSGLRGVIDATGQ